MTFNFRQIRENKKISYVHQLGGIMNLRKLASINLNSNDLGEMKRESWRLCGYSS